MDSLSWPGVYVNGSKPRIVVIAAAAKRCGNLDATPSACLVSGAEPGCVKTRRGITAPGILSPVVMRKAKKRKNSSSARHYDQIRFRFHTAWNRSGQSA